MAVIHKDVLIDPPGPGCVRSDYGMNSLRQSALDLLHVLQDARPRPIQVRSIFKYDEDVGVPEHCLCPYGFDMWGCKQGSDNGVGDLIFDDAWRLTHPGRMNNDFYVGNIRQRIERDSPQGPDSYEHKEKCPCENEEAISSAPVDPSSNHATSL